MNKEQERVYVIIMDDYMLHADEFCGEHMKINADLTVLEALEVYGNLQYRINGDTVSLIKDPVYNDDDELLSGIVIEYTDVIPKELKITGTLLDILIFAESFVKEQGNYKLVRQCLGEEYVDFVF